MPKPQFLNVDPSTLRKNPWNTNKVSPDNEAKIRASLERNGMFKPIIVRELEGQAGYEIIGGEHRWEQAIALGFTDVPVVNLGPISEKQAKEVGIIDNARYGADDAMGLADLLRELGTVEELQDFLPYGEVDLTTLFSASDIDLSALDLDEPTAGDAPEEAAPASKAPKTHTIMRFKLSLADAEWLTKLVTETQKTQGLTGSDDLTNAGDALVHLLGLTSRAADEEDEGFALDDFTELDAALGALND